MVHGFGHASIFAVREVAEIRCAKMEAATMTASAATSVRGPAARVD